MFPSLPPCTLPTLNVLLLPAAVMVLSSDKRDTSEEAPPKGHSRLVYSLLKALEGVVSPPQLGRQPLWGSDSRRGREHALKRHEKPIKPQATTTKSQRRGATLGSSCLKAAVPSPTPLSLSPKPRHASCRPPQLLLVRARETKAARITCQQLGRFSHPRQQVCRAQACGEQHNPPPPPARPPAPQGLHLRGRRTDLTKWQMSEFLSGKWHNHLTRAFPSVETWHFRLSNPGGGFLRKRGADTVRFSFHMFWSGPQSLTGEESSRSPGNQDGPRVPTYRGQLLGSLSPKGAFRVAPTKRGTR